MSVSVCFLCPEPWGDSPLRIVCLLPSVDHKPCWPSDPGYEGGARLLHKFLGDWRYQQPGVKWKERVKMIPVGFLFFGENFCRPLDVY